METSPRRTVHRVPPRRKRPRRNVWRGTVWPLVKFALILVAGVVFIGKVVRPFRLYENESRATQKLQQDLENYRKDNALLERRIKYLQTPEGAAQAARKLGWVKPGEVTLVLPEKQKRR